MAPRLFPAQLKYFRGLRGLSQLDLALAAGVSARHLAFLESGRSRPSEEMVLRLFSALDVSLRERNEALRAAGFSPRFAEPPLDALPPAVDQAIARMMAQQEPYPLTVLSLDSDIVRGNRAATRLFGRFVLEPPTERPNLFSLVFDPRHLRPFVVDWETLARSMVARLHREALSRRDDRLFALLDRVFGFPGVPRDWQQPDFSLPASPTLTVRLRRDGLSLAFLTTVTVFSAPQDVTLEELRIESSFPLDDGTVGACARLAAEDP